MRHHDDRAALALELLDAVEALALERLVADRQHLVDEEDVGLDVHRDREAETDVHARRVEAHLGVDELVELGEGHDVVEAPGELLARHPEDGAVEVDVLAAGELGVEPGAELEQRRDPAARDDLTAGRAQDPGDALEQRRLARAVVTEQADGRALRHLEVDVLAAPRTPRAARARGGSPAP